MEFMDGGSLYEWLHSDVEIGWDVRLRYDKTQSILHSSLFYPSMSTQ